MKAVIDRIEEDYLVVELDEDNFININKKFLPDAKEGDVLSIEIDKTETETRKKNIEKLMNSLFED